MIKKWSMSYPAVNGTEQRRAYVYLPTMYEAQPERRFPVLYMFDGQPQGGAQAARCRRGLPV